ncbi:MAG: Gfo/Idh/MocA family oxidoreductase [Oscillospiraceae bacterium]|nr:Gfo/Idh/MocA family oxidoreductase [Oscillospiraceae bacterium]
MLKIGMAGARCLSFALGFKNHPEDVELTALCDLDENVLKENAEKHGITKTYRVYEDMLESDIDAVVVATPMQFHAEQVIKALEAGKHVLSEVTAGVTMDELWWLIEAVEKSGKTYMFAENYAYIPQNQVIAGMVKDGLFGRLYFGEGEYLHNIRDRLVYPDGKKTWRNWWQCGKRGCFYPTHSVGPVMQWFANGGDKIKSVISLGSGQNVAKETGLRQDDTTITLCRLESGGLVNVRVDCMSNRPHNLSYYSLQGTNGCYEAPRGLGDDHKVWINDGVSDAFSPKWQPLSDYYEKYLPDRFKNATEEQKNTGHWGGDFFLVDDFLEAVKTGAKPAIDIYDACEWTAVGLLSEISATNNGREIMMPDFRGNLPLEQQITKLF